MADFVAVIRRAVDGLSDNTPEMRAKVYEKARGAVVRQLENMKPRPPEVMFKRQLDKLDDAIRQVEEENSGAAPAIQEEVADQAPPAADAEPVLAQPAGEPESAVSPLAEAAPVHDQPAPPMADEPARDEASIQASEPVRHDEPARHEEPVWQDEAAPEQVAARHEDPAAETFAHHGEAAHDLAEPEPTDEERAHHEPVREESVTEYRPVAAVDYDDDPVLAHAEPARSHVSNRVVEQPFIDSQSEFPRHDTDHVPGAGEQHAVEHAPHATHEDLRHDEPRTEQAVERQSGRAESAMPDWTVDIDREPETVVADEYRDEPPVQPQMPRAALTEADVATGFNDFLKEEFSRPGVQPPPARKGEDGEFSWDAPFDDLPDLPRPVAFEAALEAKQREIDAAPQHQAEDPRQKNARAELEDLIGYSGQSGADASDDGDKLPPEVSRAMSKLEGKTFKVHKNRQKRFNPLPIVLGVVAALLVAGGAYGVYHYRDDVSALVASYMPSDAAEKKPAETKPADDKPSADVAKSVPTETAKATEDGEPTEVASLDPNIAPTKFTQRLLADGSETETDAAKIAVDQTLTEGKTIAGQTEAGEQVASTDASVPSNTDQANAETPGLGVTQKMFLYEEQLGGSPVAVPGTVTWSVKSDTTGDKKLPMIEANIDVPDRKMKALISFKRNTDVSLPASHIIELVFDLPENFSEGNVEKVERVAFKQTEQDRGNSLIAVPAKITDDFHMVALNDDADARKVNGELMKTRSWIDIPITYRNNRRALITLEKGATGTEAFDKVIAEWAALGAQVNNN